MAANQRLCTDFFFNRHKLHFPVLKRGDDPQIWIRMADQNFDYYGVPMECRVFLSQNRMEYEVNAYLKSELKGDVSWDDWCCTLYDEFRKPIYGFNNIRFTTFIELYNTNCYKIDAGVIIELDVEWNNEHHNEKCDDERNQGKHQPFSGMDHTTCPSPQQSNHVYDDQVCEPMVDAMIFEDEIDGIVPNETNNEVMPCAGKEIIQTTINTFKDILFKDALKVFDESTEKEGDSANDNGNFGLKTMYEDNHTAWDPGKQANSDGSKDEGNSAIVAALGEYRSAYKNKKVFIRYLISSNIGKPTYIFVATALGMYDHSLAIQLVDPLNHRTCALFDSSSYIDALNAESRFADHFGMHTMCSFMDHTEISTCPTKGPDKRSVIVRGIYTSYHLSEEHKIIYVQEFTRKIKCIFVFIQGKEGQISILFNGAGNMNFDWIFKDTKMHEDGPVKDHANPGLKKPRERVRILVSKHYQLPDNLIRSEMVDKSSMKVSHYERWCISLEDNLLMKYMGLLSSSGSGIRRIIETLLRALLNDWLQQRNQQQKLGIKSQQQVVVGCSLIYSMYNGRSITFNGCILVNGGTRNSGICVTVSRTVQDSVGYCFYELSQRCLVSDWSLLLKLCISCLVFVATKLPSILVWFVPKLDCAAIGELVREMKLSALFKVAGMYEVAIQLGLNSDSVLNVVLKGKDGF